MSLTILSPPAAEPVTLSEVKDHLRVTHTDEDALITGLAVAARNAVEARGQIALVAQGWRLSLDVAPSREFILPLAPVLSVDEVSVVNGAAEWNVLEDSVYDFAPGSPGRIRCKGAWPTPAVSLNGVRIDFTAGWPDGLSVPADLKQAVKLLAASFYENREAAGENRVYAIPGAIDALIAPHRQVRL